MLGLDAAQTAVLGTALGALIGGGTALYARRMQQHHEDRTRFHREILNAYADMTEAAERAMTDWQTGRIPDAETSRTFIRSYQLLTLLAPIDARARAYLFFDELRYFTPRSTNAPDRLAYTKAKEALAEELRKLLGIPSIPA